MIKIVSFLLIFCFLSLSSIAESAIYYVGQATGDSDSNSCSTATTDSNGSRKRTIQNALTNCAKTGDTVSVKAGTYNEWGISFPANTITVTGQRGAFNEFL